MMPPDCRRVTPHSCSAPSSHLVELGNLLTVRVPPTVLGLLRLSLSPQPTENRQAPITRLANWSRRKGDFCWIIQGFLKTGVISSGCRGPRRIQCPAGADELSDSIFTVTFLPFCNQLELHFPR